jgi:hypothetical protein
VDYVVRGPAGAHTTRGTTLASRDRAKRRS